MVENIVKKGAKAKRHAVVDREHGVAWGACEAVCSRGAIVVWKGSFSVVNDDLCVGCGRCSAECPASAISIEVRA